MKELKVVLEKHGCSEVQTYIQSGNVIFDSAMSDAARVAATLRTAMSKSHGFEPEVIVLKRSELEQAATANPFPQADANPKSLHLFFFPERPKKPDLKSLELLKTKSEAFVLKDKIFYLHAPDGFGISKLAELVERALGVLATARNWRMVRTLIELAKA